MKVLVNKRSHIALQHMFISDSFADQRLFNISADCEVNSYIDNLPKDACRASAIGLQDGLGTKAYYEALTQKQQQQQAKNPQKPCNGGQGGNSQQSQSQAQQGDKKEEEDNSPSPSQSKPTEPENKPESEYPDSTGGFKQIDTHATWKDFKNIPEATKQLMQNNVTAILKSTAEQVEKQRGTIPAELKEIIEKLREKKPEIFNWKAYFRRLLGSIYDVSVRSSRRKLSKRFEGSAGIQHKKKVSILVAVDTSGSVSTKELQDFFSEIEYIYKAGARVTILQCDSRISSIDEYDGKKIPKITGRGGTDFNPPVEWYIKHKKEYASLIYFTDGECSLPVKHPSGMVWVITSNGYHQEYPGKVIYIPKEQ